MIDYAVDIVVTGGRCKTCGKKLPDNQEYSFCDDKCSRKHKL